jgi:chemotaxis methyl-accepting protein methylase
VTITAETLVRQDDLLLDLLLNNIYRDTGYDFRDYKRGTLIRRLDRRLHATDSKNYVEYMHFLDNNPEEYQKLVDYLTIQVSGFFRSPYSMQQVAKLVLPELVSRKQSEGERKIRVWSTACARGQEPYSMAILLAELLGNQSLNFDISIDATDISQRVMDEAQAGLYSTKDLEGLPPAILRNYFTPNGQGYRVNADIRKMVTFSPFDLTTAPTLHHRNQDCIFCCNVLIYFQKQLQERVLDMLYCSLATPGYLVLGEAETLTSALRDRLQCLDSKARIYKKV